MSKKATQTVMPKSSPKRTIIKVEVSLMGRAPDKGRVSFRTGIQKTRRQRTKVRGDKYGVREKVRQLRGE